MDWYIKKFITKHLSHVNNSKIRNVIKTFQQGKYESHFRDWDMFKELPRQCPTMVFRFAYSWKHYRMILYHLQGIHWMHPRVDPYYPSLTLNVLN